MMGWLWNASLFTLIGRLPAPTVASAAKDAVGNIDLAKIQQVKDTVDSFTTEETKKDDWYC